MALFHPIGIRPTGHDGAWTRRDHLRGAAWNVLWASLCYLAIRIDSAGRGDSSALGIVAMVALVFAAGAALLRLIAAALGWRRYLQGHSFVLRR